MRDRETYLGALKARDYRGAEVRSYPEPSPEEQHKALQEAQAKGCNRRRPKT